MDDHGAWRTRSRRTLLASGPVREVAVEVVELPDGRTIADYHTVRLPDYVLVYAVMRDGTVPMLRQYKHGPRRICLTFPGGGIDDGETPLAAARRELREETGCAAQTWEALGSFVANANQGCNRVHLFRATGCEVVAEPRPGDLEAMSLIFLAPSAHLGPAFLEDIGLTSHAMLLLLATHPALTADRASSPPVL
jgi:ADP-ribose pyrophosphatase